MKKKRKLKTDKLNKYIPYLIRYSWIIFILVILIFFRKAIILTIFVILAALPQLYKRFIPYPLGIELITFFTVLNCYWLNPFAAWLLSFPMMVLGMIFDGHYLHKWSIIKYTVVCLLAYILIAIGTPISLAGIIITILVNIMFIVLWSLTSGGAVITFIPGLLINAILNVMLFSRIGELVLSAIKL